MKYAKVFLIFFILFILNLWNIYVYATDDVILTDTEKNTQNLKSINDIVNTWKEYSDQDLNDIIANSDDIDIASFLYGLSDEELDEILKKDTMLLNQITFYETTDNLDDEICSKLQVESREIYWKYLLSLANRPQLMSVIASSKTGYYYLVITGNGVTTKRKVQITITNTDLAKQQTASFSEVSVSGYSDNHSFTLTAASAKTQLASQSGSQSYYEIAVVKFTYKKPAHYRASGSYSNKVDGYRFNFKPYNLENNLDSTVNNTGHNESTTTETIQMQVNVMNAGMIKDSSGNTHHATATITLSLYYGGLKVNPNRWGLEQYYRYIIIYCAMYKDKEYF